MLMFDQLLSDGRERATAICCTAFLFWDLMTLALERRACLSVGNAKLYHYFASKHVTLLLPPGGPSPFCSVASTMA